MKIRNVKLLIFVAFTLFVIFPVDVNAEEITNIEITGFNEPVIGQKPRFTAMVSEDANYFVYLEAWQGNNSTMIESVPNSSIKNEIDIFKENVTYLYSVYIKPKEGYNFADNFIARIDGIILDSYRIAGNTIIFEYEYGKAREVDFKISNVTMPVANQTPSYTGIVPEGSNYKIHEEVWYDSNGDVVLDNFKSGKEYTYYCVIAPLDNSLYKEPLYATVNGNNIDFHSNEGNLYVFTYKYVIKDEGYKVIFDANGGKFETSNTYIINNWHYSNYDNLIKPTREGYEFKGYFTEKVGGNSLERYLAEAGIDKNMIFYAQWEEEFENPDTSDNVVVFITLGLMSLASLIGITIYLKNENELRA